MKYYDGLYVDVKIPDDVYEWPAHVEEITRKAVELETLIRSIVTGKTERWR